MVPAVEMRGITKSYPGVLANDDVSFEVRKGEIHSIIGENGAGKTTLMNILFGLVKPDRGSILVHGSKVDIKNPHPRSGTSQKGLAQSKRSSGGGDEISRQL